MSWFRSGYDTLNRHKGDDITPPISMIVEETIKNRKYSNNNKINVSDSTSSQNSNQSKMGSSEEMNSFGSFEDAAKTDP